MSSPLLVLTICLNLFSFRPNSLGIFIYFSYLIRSLTILRAILIIERNLSLSSEEVKTEAYVG